MAVLADTAARDYRYRLIDYSLHQKKIWFQYFANRATFYQSITGINDWLDLASCLPTDEAYLLGQIYSYALKNGLTDKPANYKKGWQNSKQLCFLAYDHLNKQVHYKKILSNTRPQIVPLFELINDKELVSEFSPASGFYLGLLSGK